MSSSSSTSPPERGTSSPTASSATTASPVRTHTYLDFDAGRDFEREIVVKVNTPEVLRAELARPLMEAGAGRARDQHRPLPVGREPLPVHARDHRGAAGGRDADLGADQVAAGPPRHRPLRARWRRRSTSRVNLSVPTLDEKAWRATEPHTPSPRARLEAVAEAEGARDRLRRPDRAADAGHQRLARAGRAAGRDGARGRRRLPRRRRASPARRGPRGLLRLACAPSAPTCCPTTSGSTPTAAPTCARPTAELRPGRCAAGAGAAPGAARRARRDRRRPRPPRRRQTGPARGGQRSLV